MGMYTGNVPIQNLWHSGAVSSVHIDGQLVWPVIPPDWLWLTDNSEVTLLLYQGSSNPIRIPSFVGGLPVTALAPSACNYINADTVTIPQSAAILG